MVHTTDHQMLQDVDIDSDRPFLFGAQDSVINGNVPMGNFLLGEMDDIRIYKLALNKSQIDSLYNEENPLRVGVNKNLLNQIDIYPNPCSNHFNLQMPENTISADIIDANGKAVMALNIQSQIHNIECINPGTYIVRCIGIEGVYLKRIIID